jgi:hypothetical protein
LISRDVFWAVVRPLSGSEARLKLAAKAGLH